MESRLALSLVVALSAMSAGAAAQDAPVADPGAAPSAEPTGEPFEAAPAPEAAPAEVATVPVDGAASAEAEVPAEEAGSHNRLADEIVVTAQKREENILDVPISMNAFSGDQLDAKGI